MNTTEKNILINNFLGEISEYESENPLFNITYCYHLDWNLLMQVVEKIKSIPNKEEHGILKYQVDVILDVPNARIVDSYKLMTGSKDEKFFDVIHYENSFFKNVYNACITFIEWYNKNLDKPKN